MTLRLIEIFLPDKNHPEIRQLLEDFPILDTWEESMEGDRFHVKILLPTENTESVLDRLEKRYSGLKGFRIMLLPVEASIPRPEKPAPEAAAETEETAKAPSVKRISREELYADIEQMTHLSWVYFVLVILSSIVASIGIIRDNVIYVIAAMVIAPLLGPNVAMSLATTLGDIGLSRRAIRANLAGIGTALLFSAALGAILRIDPSLPGLVSRTDVSLGDIVLALAAGSAAVLSFTTGILSALIGVMVAVALLPPLVALGLLLGSGHWAQASGALLLLLANVASVNLAGVVTFLVQGIRPLTWWEAKRARKRTQTAILFWAVFLALLASAIWLSR